MGTRSFKVVLSSLGLVAIATWGLAQAPSRDRSGTSPRGSLTSSERDLDAARPLGGASPSLERELFPESRSSATEIRVQHALVLSLAPVKVPARDAGVIKGDLLVEKGATVKQGDILGQIDDQDLLFKKIIAERERDAAKKQAESEAQLQAAKDGASVTEENYKANQKLRKDNPGSISEFEFRRSLYEWQRAQAQIKVAQEEKDVAYLTQLAKEAQIQGTDNEIERRKIVAPIDGDVTEVYKHNGEWCQPGDPVLEIIRMDRLEVEGFVYSADASPAQVRGKPVKVIVELAGGGTFDAQGTIEFASPILEGSGRIRQFRVAAKIDNKRVADKDGKESWFIQPGTGAEMIIDLRPPAPKPATRSTTTPGLSRPGLPGLPRPKVEANKPVVSPDGTKAGETASEKKSSEADDDKAKVTDAKDEPAKAEAKSNDGDKAKDDIKSSETKAADATRDSPARAKEGEKTPAENSPEKPAEKKEKEKKEVDF